MTALEALDYDALDERALVERILNRDPTAIRLLTTRNNQRLFRTAWSILRSRPEAEEAVQEGYLKGFAGLSAFKGESSLSTWLTRIVVNEALTRRRAALRRATALEMCGVASMDAHRQALAQPGHSPESEVMRRQLAAVLETAIAGLPEPFRVVFVLREVEAMSVADTADVLGIGEATVKTRLFRAKQRLRDALASEVGNALADTCLFAGADCAAMTERVLARLT